MENTALITVMMGIIIFLLLVLIYALTKQKKHTKETENPESKEHSRILKNYENSLQIISKIEQDNSALLFFYREYIHKMAYLNPIHRYVRTFGNEINNIDEKLSQQDKVNMFGEYLDKIGLFKKENELEEYIKMIVSGLCISFSNIDEKLSIINKKQNEIFYQKVFNCIAEIIQAKQADIEKIEALYKILAQYYPKWKSILTTPFYMDIVKGFFIGIKASIVGQSGGTIGDVINVLKEINNLKDEEFIKSYNDATQKFIELSQSLAQALDIKFTAIEILYQKHKEKERASLFKEIQTSLQSGKDINDLYSTWREAQHNKVIKDIFEIEEYIIDGLKTKNIDENTIDNIREMVC